MVVTLHPDQGDYWEGPIEALGIPLLRAPRRWGWPGRVSDLTRLLRPHRPELVHAWHLFASPYAALAGRLLGARGSLGSLRASYAYFERHRLLAAVTPALVDGLVVNSRTAAAQLAQRHRSLRGRIHWIGNAVEEPSEPRARVRGLLSERFGIPTGRVWLGSAGRFDSGKRLDLVIDAFARVVESGTDAQLILIGDGEARESLEARVKRAGLQDRVRFTGLDPAARSWMSALDVFCFASIDEGLPNVVLEAAAAGVPIVAWRTDFLDEALQDGESAILVQSAGLEGYVQALAGLIADPAKRERVGRQARRSVLERFGVNRFVSELTATYERLLERPR